MDLHDELAEKYAQTLYSTIHDAGEGAAGVAAIQRIKTLLLQYSWEQSRIYSAELHARRYGLQVVIEEVPSADLGPSFVPVEEQPPGTSRRRT